MIYLENNVFEEALARIRFIYEYHDDVIVSMSGGKDSTVLFHLTLQVAQELGRLPVKVFWLDQEAEWQATVDYMATLMQRPDVKPYWFQIPFEFTNTLSPEKNFISVWKQEDKAMWIHEQHPLSIKQNPCKANRFHDLVNELPDYCTDSDNCAVLVGMRIVEQALSVIADFSNGPSRVKLVELVYFTRRFTVEGAAMQIPISVRQAYQWNDEYLKQVWGILKRK